MRGRVSQRHGDHVTALVSNEKNSENEWKEIKKQRSVISIQLGANVSAACIMHFNTWCQPGQSQTRRYDQTSLCFWVSNYIYVKMYSNYTV